MWVFVILDRGYNPVVRHHAELMTAWQWIRKEFGEQDASALALDMQLFPIMIPYQVCATTPQPRGVG